eukprot:58527-Amphidinium_carterae.1
MYFGAAPAQVSFRAWLGQQSTLSAEDFGAILGFLDPSLKGVDVSHCCTRVCHETHNNCSPKSLDITSSDDPYDEVIALLPSGTSECLSIDEVLDAIFTF